jgi:hypothetical protein
MNDIESIRKICPLRSVVGLDRAREGLVTEAFTISVESAADDFFGEGNE